MGLPQCFEGTPQTVRCGELVPVKFFNPDLANSTVQVTVIYENGSTSQLEILLDDSGRGSTNYLAPDGAQAVLLTHESSQDFDIICLP